MLRVGLLGASAIAPQAMIEPARRRKDIEVRAVASRRPGAAADYAALHGIGRAYDTYEALIADPGIDLIYNALPPSGHARFSIAALEAGKHVLCEKPFALNAEEARAMVETAERTGRQLIEGFHYRYHPAFLHLLHLRDSGALGKIISITAEFTGPIPFGPERIEHKAALGGGALMHAGCYAVHWARTLADAEPVITASEITVSATGVDERVAATFQFPNGITANIRCDMAPEAARCCALSIICEAGSVEIDNPVLPHLGHTIRERLRNGFRHHTVGGDTSFDHQLDTFVNILAGRVLPITGGADAIGNMAAIDAIYAKAGLARRPAATG